MNESASPFLSEKQVTVRQRMAAKPKIDYINFNSSFLSVMADNRLCADVFAYEDAIKSANF